jgi:hypothetical protein
MVSGAQSSRTGSFLDWNWAVGAARDLLTGEFKDSYTSLTHDVVTRIEAEAYFRGGQLTRRGVNVSER